MHFCCHVQNVTKVIAYDPLALKNKKLAKSPFGLYKFSPILPKLLLTNPHREDRRISMTIFETDVVKSLT